MRLGKLKMCAEREETGVMDEADCEDWSYNAVKMMTEKNFSC